MSTRSEIVFKRESTWKEPDGTENSKTETITTYKHHDGYPRVTVPQLREFHEFAASRANDIEYYAASWIYWYKRRKERYDRSEGYKDLNLLEKQEKNYDDAKEARDDFEVPPMLTGVGICADDHIHGDVHNVYVVDLNKGEIWHYTHGVDSKESVPDLISDYDPKRVYQLDEEPSAGFNSD